MSARESIANYPSRRREMTNYALREIKKVSSEIGPRISGEESERKMQALVAESHRQVADTVEVEEFEAHPKAFTGWIPIDVILLLGSVVLLMLSHIFTAQGMHTAFSIAALVLTAAATGLAVAGGLLHKSLLDAFFPKQQSCNVVCTRRASGETKRRILFVGHADSSYEWTYVRLGGKKLSAAITGSAFAAMLLLLVLELISLFSVPEWLTTVILILAGVSAVPILLGAFLISRKAAALGANHNLTGVFASMAVLRYMAANNIRFENTEVVAVSLACSQAGGCGAKAFAEKHANDGVETAVIVTDTLCDAQQMCIRQKELAGTCKADTQTAALLRRAGAIAGVDLGDENALIDASDAAPLGKGGMHAAALTAKGEKAAQLAHTRKDTVDQLNPKAVETGIDILLETAFLFDAEGLKDQYTQA